MRLIDAGWPDVKSTVTSCNSWQGLWCEKPIHPGSESTASGVWEVKQKPLGQALRQ